MTQTKPLSGIRVLDLTRLMPGSICTLHLADMGADVIKVEDPWEGDYSRSIGAKDDATALYYLVMNRNKRSLKLNLKLPRGRDLFQDLARNAQVIVESFRPDVVDRLGIGYEAIKHLNPQIVYCSISGYGQTGPYRHKTGHDINYCAYAGIIDQIGQRGGPPVLSNFQIADTVGGALCAVMGILAAIVDTQRGGSGRHIDVSMTDCSLAHNIMPLVALNETGDSHARGEEMLSGGLPGYGLYETADGRYMAVGAIEQKFWKTFCETLERPDLIDKNQANGEEAQDLRCELASLFKTHTQAYWIERFDAVECCVSPVMSLGESKNNEQFRAREMFVSSKNGERDAISQYAFPLKMSDFEFSLQRPAPRHGEHSKQILSEAGYDEEKIAELEKEGVI